MLELPFYKAGQENMSKDCYVCTLLWVLLWLSMPSFIRHWEQHTETTCTFSNALSGTYFWVEAYAPNTRFLDTFPTFAAVVSSFGKILLNATTLGSNAALAQVIHQYMLHCDTSKTFCRHSSCHASGFGRVSFTGAPTKMRHCSVHVTCTVQWCSYSANPSQRGKLYSYAKSKRWQKNKIHRNPKPEIQNPNAKLQHFLSRFWVSFFRDATPGSWGLPSWKRTARWFNHSCRLHCNLSYRSIGDHITSEGIYSMTYSGDFGRVNWKSAPTWTFSECLTSLGNLARSNLLEICADLAHINAHPCVFYLLHPRVFRTRQWCFLGRPLTSAINPAIRLCIFVEACWTAKIAVFRVQ